ncbi:hypothetical protein DM860_015828 [Cuscuta australis]|uniref:Uncharacterized protein n=1 Tax=Cuscuta australis TaxID=267555 RepID=A0A328E2M6_9ASTE|nr:hypothetical protein DM860_015828 [Cuscuta australis]
MCFLSRRSCTHMELVRKVRGGGSNSAAPNMALFGKYATAVPGGKVVFVSIIPLTDDVSLKWFVQKAADPYPVHVAQLKEQIEDMEGVVLPWLPSSGSSSVAGCSRTGARWRTTASRGSPLSNSSSIFAAVELSSHTHSLSLSLSLSLCTARRPCFPLIYGVYGMQKQTSSNVLF